MELGRHVCQCPLASTYLLKAHRNMQVKTRKDFARNASMAVRQALVPSVFAVFSDPACHCLLSALAFSWCHMQVTSRTSVQPVNQDFSVRPVSQHNLSVQPVSQHNLSVQPVIHVTSRTCCTQTLACHSAAAVGSQDHSPNAP